MSISRVHTWSNGEVLTHTDLNAEFDNILNNALSLISPLTGDLAAGGNDITGLDELALNNIGAASAAGRLRRNATQLSWHDGTAARTVALHNISEDNFNFTTPAADYTNATNAYTDVTGYSLALTTNGGSVLIMACGPGHCTAGDTAVLTIRKDAVDGAGLAFFANGGQINIPWTIMAIDQSVAAGAHTYKVRGKTITGAATLTINTGSIANGFMVVTEMRA